jgi:hypothetical protein
VKTNPASPPREVLRITPDIPAAININNRTLGFLSLFRRYKTKVKDIRVFKSMANLECHAWRITVRGLIKGRSYAQ